jgi:hypothetical protein
MTETEGMTGSRTRRMIGGGALAGAIGGLVISLLMLALRGVRGEDPWVGLKVAGYPFLHDRVLRPGFDGGAVLLGLADHLAVSAVWGILFALLAFGLARWATVGFGAAWGLIAMFVMTYLVLPIAGCLRVEESMPVGRSVLGHVAFGVAMALAFLPFQRHQPRALNHRWMTSGASP